MKLVIERGLRRPEGYVYFARAGEIPIEETHVSPKYHRFSDQEPTPAAASTLGDLADITVIDLKSKVSTDPVGFRQGKGRIITCQLASVEQASSQMFRSPRVLPMARTNRGLGQSQTSNSEHARRSASQRMPTCCAGACTILVN
jgi:hypothetical protein